MKTLSSLTAQATDQVPPLLRGVRSAVHCEPQPGVFIHATLSADGLFLFNGSQGIHIAMADLIALADTHVPGLIPPPKS